MGKAKAKAQTGRRRANIKKNALATGNNHNKNMDDDNLGTNPYMSPNKLTDEDMARAKSESKAGRKMGITVIGRAKIHRAFGRDIHLVALKIKVEPELIPVKSSVNTQTKSKLTGEDDMGKEKARAIA